MPEPHKDSPTDHHLDPEHDPEECYDCLLQETVINTCRCAACCRALIIEACVEDAEREPRIREKGSPIYTPAPLTESGQEELSGYLLNGKDACVLLDPETNLCTIHATRPLTCRLFDCDGAGREQLVELGILDRADAVTVAFPPVLQAWVGERVREGGFIPVSAYLRHLVLEDQKRQESLLEEALDRAHGREEDQARRTELPLFDAPPAEDDQAGPLS
jgi:hypothetical protein